MSAKKPDIEQIRKYLDGELDARAMHKLEREAQDDPFMAEAMEGFESATPDQQANFADLQARLAQRIEPAKERNIWLWRVLPLAACLLIALLAGYWYFSPKQAKQQYANVVKPNPIVETLRPVDSVKPAAATPIAATQPKLIAKRAAQNPAPDTATTRQQPANFTNGLTRKVAGLVVYKADTVEYKAADFKVDANSTVDDLLKHMEGFEVGKDGSVTHQGQTVAKARLNGKDYAGGNMQQALQTLPADIVEKIQVVDDYGDQAAKTGVKNGDPNKILNFTTRPDSGKKSLVANNVINQSNHALKELAVVNPKQLEAKKSDKPLLHVVTGVVTDNKGEALIGAAVKLKDNAQIYTVTDINGNFKIALPANGSLVVSSVGFQSLEVKAGRQDTLKVRLEATSNGLSEVVVINTATRVGKIVTGSPVFKADTVGYQVARPITGWNDYYKYLQSNAVTPAGETGAVEVGFMISDDGTPENIHIISSDNQTLNEKAMYLVSKGAKWIKGSDKKESRLKIKFHR